MTGPITRRALMAGASTIAAVAVVPAFAARPDPLRDGVQALVNEIRHELSREIPMICFWTLQQAADRLEALPGIRANPNEEWDRRKPDIERHGGKWPLRPTGGAS